MQGRRRSRAAGVALVVSAALIGVGPRAVAGQQPGGEQRGDALRVFLDCNTRWCDSEYFRTEIGFVNWVRDRTVSQVHLLVTSNQTGGGGNVFTLDFIGVGDLDGDDDRLQVTTLATATEAEVLDALTGVLAAGLARYSAVIGQPAGFRVTTVETGPDTDRLVAEQDVNDPWNFWVFELSTEVEFSGEETEKENQYEGSFEARRTTDTWRIEFEADGDFSRNERELSDSSVSIDERTNWSVDGLIVYSLAESWSLGVLGGARASTSRNQDFGAQGAIALEYSFLPYEEAPRRSLTARYDVQLQYYDWEERTIFGKTYELRPRHQLGLDLFQRQPWGESRVSVTARQFLDDPGLWSLDLFAEIELRIVRGLNLDVRGGVDLLEDQIFISGEGLTDEEILLGRYERPTDYSYFISTGLSFEFGSIFNNVVSNRFDN